MAKKKTLLELPVQFGGVAFGDKTVRLGVSVEREHLTLQQGDEVLCDKRLECKVTSKHHREDQKNLPGIEGTDVVAGVADAKGFRVSAKEIGFGLTFVIESCDSALLSHFAKKSGKLLIHGCEDLESENGDGHEEGETE